MNNEKQHSEYKIIETVATPTFDGVSVETHPEDQLGGDTPKNILVDGKYKYGVISGALEYFIACTVKDGRVFVYAESLDGENNINIYLQTGEFLANNGTDELMQTVRDICEKYENFVDVTKEVQPSGKIANFEKYKEL